MSLGGSLAGSLAGSMAGGEASPLTISPNMTGFWWAGDMAVAAGAPTNLPNLAQRGTFDLSSINGTPTVSSTSPTTIECVAADVDFIKDASSTDLTTSGGSICFIGTFSVASLFTGGTKIAWQAERTGVSGVVLLWPGLVSGKMGSLIYTNAGSINLSHTFSDTGMHTWAIVYDAATGGGRLLLDGVQVTSGTSGTGTAAAVRDVTMGASAAGASPCSMSWRSGMIMDYVPGDEELAALIEWSMNDAQVA